MVLFYDGVIKSTGLKNLVKIMFDFYGKSWLDYTIISISLSTLPCLPCQGPFLFEKYIDSFPSVRIFVSKLKKKLSFIFASDLHYRLFHYKFHLNEKSQYTNFFPSISVFYISSWYIPASSFYDITGA